MENYNVQNDNGYKVSNSYASLNLPNNSYATSNVSLPIYSANTSEPKPARRSKCPRGAKLGEIGSCCGWDCTRACAISGDN